MAKVRVIEINITPVEALACHLSALIGGTLPDGIGCGKLAVDKLIRRCACVEVDFEGLSFRMKAAGSLRDGSFGTSLGVPEAVNPESATLSPLFT